MSENAPPPQGPGLTFGEELRQEREIRGISLAEIADTTKISKRFLQAIERNDFASLPAPVFTRGFVREYARYLGLNAEEMVDRYAHYVQGAQSGDDDQPLPLKSGAPVDRPARAARSGLTTRVAGVVLVLVVAVAAFALWRSGTFRRNAAEPSGDPPLAGATVVPQVHEPGPGEPRPIDESLSLVMEARSPVWIVVEADGERVLREQLAAGARRTVTAQRRINLEIGDPSGLEMTLNGLSLPQMGEPGRVVRGQLDLDYLREARARAGVTPSAR